MASKRISKKAPAPARRTRKPRPAAAKGSTRPAVETQPGRSLRLTAAVTPEEGGYVARCIEVEVSSQGDTVEESLANLREALELYFEDETAARPTASPIIAPVDLAL